MPPTLKRKVLERDDFGLCVLLPKTDWDRFAQPGRSSLVAINGRRRRVGIASKACNCRGDTPHEHRFLTLPASAGLKPGERVTIEIT